MGNGIYGIQAVLDIYFQSKDIESLSHEEIIEILTRIHTPNL
jgi:membrane carboxypeptidase/penicillin-binding protein